MFNVNFSLLKTIYVHLLVCYLNKLQNARCNGKDAQHLFQLLIFLSVSGEQSSVSLEREYKIGKRSPVTPCIYHML